MLHCISQFCTNIKLSKYDSPLPKKAVSLFKLTLVEKNINAQKAKA